jgi:proteasome beta subunit
MSTTSNQFISKGTTTIGVVCKNGVILASDTRAVLGTFVAHKKAKKVYKIDDHLAMTISGSVADAQRTVEILKANAKLYKLNQGRPMPVNSSARLVANFFSSMPMIAWVLVGGVDDTGPHIFNLDPLGSLTEETCVATGSGSPIAYGLLEDEYKKDMTIKSLLPVVVRAVNSAMKRDVNSGDSFDVTTIDEKGFYELTDEEKKTILG